MPWNDLHRQPKRVLKHYFGASLHYSIYYIRTLNALLPSVILSYAKNNSTYVLFFFLMLLYVHDQKHVSSINGPKNSPWSEPVIISSLPTKYNTRHKSLKQEPFALNFLLISYIHSWHLRSQLHLPLSFPNVEPRVFWSSETTVIPKSTLGKGKITQVFQDLWRVL